MGKITLGMFLNAIDPNRDHEDNIRIMDNNGEIELQGKSCSLLWEGIENRTINSLRSAGKDIFDIWLDAECQPQTGKSTLMDSVKEWDKAVEKNGYIN